MTTPERGLVLKPHGECDGIITDYELDITVKMDFNCAKCLATRNGAPVTFRSYTQKMVSLMTTKAELNAAVIGMQDALFVKNILKTLRLKVKLPTLASIDNGRPVDIGNNWSVGGRTCHVKVKQNFLQELKEAGII